MAAGGRCSPAPDRSGSMSSPSIPFWTKRAEGLPLGDAYVAATVPPDPSGDDRGLIALEFTPDTSRARMMALVRDAGFEPGALWVRRLPGDTRAARAGRGRWAGGRYRPAPERHRRAGRAAGGDRRLRRAAGRERMNKPARARKCFPSPPMSAANRRCRGWTTPLKLSSNEGAFGPPPGAQEAMAEAAGEHAPLPGRRIAPRCATRSARDSGWTRRASSAATAPTSCWCCSSSPMAGRARDVDHERARLLDLSDRRQARRLHGDQGARAQPDHRCGRHAGARSPRRRGWCSSPTRTTRPARCCRRARWLRLRAGLPGKVLLVIDAAYAEYVDRPDYDAGAAAGGCRRQHGDDAHLLQDLRPGRDAPRLGLCAAAIVDVLNRVRAPFNVNSFAAGRRHRRAGASRAGWRRAARTTPRPSAALPSG